MRMMILSVAWLKQQFSRSGFKVERAIAIMLIELRVAIRERLIWCGLMKLLRRRFHLLK